MEDTMTKILATLDANGGRVPYQTMIDSLTPAEQQQYPNAIRKLKSQGIAQQQNRVLPEGGVAFEVFRIGAPIPAPQSPPPVAPGPTNPEVTNG